MGDIRWSDDFLIGVEFIDNHNKYFVELLAQAEEDLEQNQEDTGGRNGTDEVLDYIFFHFASEEIWMSRRKYPKLSRHMEDHLRCTSLMVEWNRKCHTGSVTAIEVLCYMFQALVPHITSFDAQYADHFAVRS